MVYKIFGANSVTFSIDSCKLSNKGTSK